MRNIATLTSQKILRVADKYFGKFILHDDDVRKGPRFLYLVLFFVADNDGVCRISQAELSKLCDFSIRSLQGYLSLLSKLEYISIEPQEDGRSNSYRLLLSDRARRSMLAAAVDLLEPREKSSHEQAQNLRVSDAKFAPLYNKKEENKENINISPLPVSASSRDASDCAAKEQGKGILLPEKTKQAEMPSDSDSDFEKLFSAYPVKQNYFYAKKTYEQLRRQQALPSVSQLIDVINLFMESDPVWQGGFAPNLCAWLSGRRWLDQPRSKNSGAVFSGKCGLGRPENQDEPLPSPALQQEVKAIQENFAKTPFPRHGFLHSPISGAVKPKVSVEQSRMRSTVSNTREDTRDPDVSSEAWKAAHGLCGLWKTSLTTPVLTYLEYLASKNRLPDTAALLASAEEYLAGTSKPLSLAQWLRDSPWSRIRSFDDTHNPDGPSDTSNICKIRWSGEKVAGSPERLEGNISGIYISPKTSVCPAWDHGEAKRSHSRHPRQDE